MKLYKIVFFCFTCFIATACAQQKKYISYTVKNGETIKSIAERLDMKTRDLLRLNPDVGRKPSPNTVIMIPNKAFKEVTNVVTEKDSVEVEDDKVDVKKLKQSYVIHQVKKGETIYSLTRFYNVSENELHFLNPELKDGLKLDMILKVKEISDSDEVLIYQDTIVENEISLAMLLPFRAKEYDTLKANEIFKTNALANITTDLFLGADIAVDSLKKRGLNIRLQLFDTGRKNQNIDSLLNAVDFQEFDAIVGPLYSEEIPKVANRTSIPVVFPVFSKNQTEFKSSRIIKTFPDKSEHQKELMNYLIKHYTNENLLVVGDSTTASIQNARQIQSILLQKDSIKDVKIIHSSNGYLAKHVIINSLKPDVGNWVILATDQSVIASDVVNSLISLPQEEEEEEDDKVKKKKKGPVMQILPEDTVIKIFAFDKGNQFDKIDNSKLAKLEFTFTSDVFEDENSPEVQLFNHQYFKKNYTYPSYYATKGFDIVYDISMRLASGNNLKDTFKKGISYRLETKFDYSKMLFSTSTNNGLYILQYNSDLTLQRLK